MEFENLALLDYESSTLPVSSIGICVIHSLLQLQSAKLVTKLYRYNKNIISTDIIKYKQFTSL